VNDVKVLVRESIADGGVDLLRSRFDVDVDFDSELAETGPDDRTSWTPKPSTT